MSAETLSVAQLASRIDAALAGAFPTEVWVRGEIQDLSRSGGHAYFSLVDDAGPGLRARVPVVLFDSNRRAVNAYLVRHGGVRMEDGTTVRIRGEVTYYPPQGRLQLRMTWIDPEYTLGRLAAERERLIRRLRAEGLVDRNGRLPMPAAPLRVGLVTSADSAAAADFLSELEASGLGWQVVTCDARVQGPGAAGSLAAALAAVVAAGAEVVALVRGGGARSELAAFDDEALARAVAAAPVPVLTGIGHEVDRSVVDEVAHRAFKTPTACAAALVAAVRRYVEATEGSWATIVGAAGQALDAARIRLDRSGREAAAATRRAIDAGAVAAGDATARVRRIAPAAVGRATAVLERVTGGVQAAAGGHVRRAGAVAHAASGRVALGAHRAGANAAERLDGAAARLRALDPERILARGWTLTRTVDGALVRSVAGLAPGAELTTRFPDGTARSTVQSVTPDAADD